MSIKVTRDRVGQVTASIVSLAAARVLIGYPADEALRKPEDGEKGPPPTNAAIAYWMEYGVPEMNIPARPTLIPGVTKAIPGATAMLTSFARDRLDGYTVSLDDTLDRVGLYAVSSVRREFIAGDHAPLSERTLEDRARRGRKGASIELASRAAGNVPNNANARPLIDTGQLRQAVNFVIVPVRVAQ